MADKPRGVNLFLGTGCAILVLSLAGLGYWLFAGSTPAPTPARPRIAVDRPPAPKPRPAPVPAVPVSAPAAPQAASNGVVFGVVYDGAGKPVRGANVRLLSEARSGEEAAFEVEMLTDGDGRFYFSELPRRDFQVRAVRGDLAAYEYAYLSSNEAADVTLILAPSAVLGGTVVGSGQRPVAEARLKVLRVDGNDADRESPACVSDSQGRFLLEYLAPGLYDLGVYANGFAATIAERLETGRRDHRIVLERGGRLSGRALDASSRKPAAGAVLRIVRKQGIEGELHAPCAGDGAFSIEGLADGVYSFLGAQDGRTVTPFPLVASVADGKGQDDIEVLLAAGGGISGRVYDAASKKPIEGTKVSVYRDPNEGLASIRRHTNEDGCYTFENLPPGDYTVRAILPSGFRSDSASREDYGRKQVSLAAGEHRANVDFAIPLGVRISGLVVRADGQPVPYAEVEGKRWQVYIRPPQQGSRQAPARSMPQLRGLYSTTADAEGAFMLYNGIVGETLQLQARHSQWGRSDWQEIAIPAQDLDGVRLVLQLRSRGSIAGRVVNLVGDPLRAGVSARLGEQESGDPSEPEYAHTDADGNFVFPRLEAGVWELSAYVSGVGGVARVMGPSKPPQVESVARSAVPPSGFAGPVRGGRGMPAGAFTRVELAPGAAVTGVTLTLDVRSTISDVRSTISVTGRVVDVQGEGIEDAQVRAVGDSTETYATTDRSGAYKVSVSDEKVMLAASHDHYRAGEPFAAVAGDQQADIVLFADGYLDGWVTEAETGQPVSSFEVEWVPRLGAAGILDVDDPDGHFALPMGRSWARRTITVRAQGYRSTSYEFTFTDDGLLFDANDQALDRLLITLAPGEDEIQWRVVDTQGAPLPGAFIFLGAVRSVAQALDTQVSYESDADGRFVLDPAVSENGVLSAYHPEAGIGIGYIGSESLPRVIVVEPVSTVRGQVLHENAPAANAPVFLYPGGGRSDYVAETRTDHQGHFEIDGIAAGAYTLRTYTSGEGNPPEAARWIKLPSADGTLVTLNL